MEKDLPYDGLYIWGDILARIVWHGLLSHDVLAPMNKKRSHINQCGHNTVLQVLSGTSNSLTLLTVKGKSENHGNLSTL